MVNPKVLILIVSGLISTGLLGQAPDMEWFRGQGTPTEEHVHEGMQTRDGGYIAVGHGIESSDDDDMMIIKVNENGHFQWKQKFGTAGQPGTGYCIAEVSNGYIAGGGIFDPDSQRTQRFLAKLDFDGDVIWEKFYGSLGVGGIRGIDITGDGSIVTTGYVNAPDTEEFQGFVFIVDEGDGFIMKLDTGGNVLWEELIDAPQGTKVREIDGGYAVCSCVWNWSEETGDHLDFCLMEMDDQGKPVWRYCYGGTEGDHLYDFDVTVDGGYVLAGHTVSYGVSNWDYLLMKIDKDGNEEWYQIFGQPRGYNAQYIHDEAYGVRQTPDGGYIIAGGSGDEYFYSASGHPAGPSDEWKVYLVKTDSTGNILWEGIYPETSEGNNAGEYIGLTSDGGYIVFVDTDTQTPPSPNNFGFMKIAPDPVMGINNRNSGMPANFGLLPNYPNPFNPTTRIEYSLAHSGDVVLRIYDLLGKMVTKLVDEYQDSGIYKVDFYAGDLPGGIYIARLRQGSYSDESRMVLIK